MNTEAQIKSYIDSQPEPKRSDMQALHTLMLKVLPKYKLWFEDGKNSEGEIVSNPNIGYGFQSLKYADGKTRDFYQVGISANTTGISVYIIGLEDKTYLSRTYESQIGKASITGYCIKFKKLKDINTDVLVDAVKYGVSETS